MTDEEAAQKIKEERDELIIKLEKLEKFQALDEEPQISKYQYSLLNIQQDVIRIYTEILKLRYTDIMFHVSLSHINDK